MDPTTHTPTILLAIGILCVFLAVFGGGFKIKEISIPQIDKVSRSLGAVFGLALIAWSQIGTIKMPEAGNETHTALAQPVSVASVADVAGDQAEALTPPAVLPGTDKIDELEPLWDTLEIANQDLLAEYVKIKEGEGFDDLSLIYKSEVNNKIDSLNEAIGAVSRTDAYLAGEMTTLAEKVAYLDDFSDQAQGLRLSGKDKERLAREQQAYKTAFDNSARIASSNDFLTCTSIENRNCRRSTSRFSSPARVWVWARVASPKDTQVTLRWVNLDTKEQVNSRRFTIRKSSGYRITGAKSVAESGNYEIRLYNADDALLARRQFEVR